MHPAKAPPDTAMSQLARLVSESASGEFIAATDGLEIHIYLQSGRVAWATTTESRFIFRQKLVDDFGIDPKLLNGLVEECARTKKRLGETLVQSGLLNREQVHEALRTQVVAAISSLEKSGAKQALFLSRTTTYATYDQSLTFAFDSLVTPPAEPQEQGPTAIEAVAKLMKAIPDLAWAAVCGPGDRTAAVRSTAPPLLGPMAAELQGGAEFIALRSREGAIMGTVLAAEPGRSLWCGLPPKCPLSAAVGLLTALTGAKPKKFRRPTEASFEEFGKTHLQTTSIPDILHTAGSEGLVLLDPTGASQFWSIARRPNSPVELGQTATKRQAVLALGRAQVVNRGVASTLRGPAFLCALVADSRWWWFGTELPFAPTATVWLALSRNADTLMGWALLETIARGILSGPSGPP